MKPSPRTQPAPADSVDHDTLTTFIREVTQRHDDTYDVPAIVEHIKASHFWPIPDGELQTLLHHPNFWIMLAQHGTKGNAL